MVAHEYGLLDWNNHSTGTSVRGLDEGGRISLWGGLAAAGPALQVAPHGHNQVFAHLLQKESQVSSGEQVLSHCGEA